MPDLKIKLKAPHRHAGRDYPAGATLTLREDKAQWLIGLGVAADAAAQEPAPAPAAAPAAATQE